MPAFQRNVGVRLTTKSPLPLEKDFQKRVLKQLRTIPKSFWVKTNDRVMLGLPDILGCIGCTGEVPLSLMLAAGQGARLGDVRRAMQLEPFGRFVALELKTRSKLTKLQAYILKLIRDAGGYAVEVRPDNWPEIFEALKSGRF